MRELFVWALLLLVGELESVPMIQIISALVADRPPPEQVQYYLLPE